MSFGPCSRCSPAGAAYFVLLVTVTSVPVEAVVCVSPDSRVRVVLETNERGQVEYRVNYGDTVVLAPSRLGLTLRDAPPLDRGFQITSVRRSEHDNIWHPVYGERSSVRNHYNQVIVELRDDQKSPRSMRITLRAYNEGVAFCYSLPSQEGVSQLTIASETSQFRFTGNHMAWPVYSAQGVYARKPLDQIRPNCERPLVVEMGQGPVVAIAEARLVDYARMRLMPVADSPRTLQSQLASEVVARLPYTTPWRVIMIAQSPGQLLEHNYLILNLNDPCAIQDTSWIKPGKVIREVTLTTRGGKACVDFAAKRGIAYVEFDAGWYGHEYDAASDARTVTRDPKKSGVAGELDLRDVIHYAQQRGIGILLYVNRRQLERQLDDILPLYEQWGVKGVKYGFVQVGSQRWTTWLHKAIRQAADHHLMVDVHDEYRPTGYERTFPNLMTAEGVRGNECMPPAELNLVIPFTRLLCGPADCTVCWYTDRIKTTHAHQLAAPVVFYSPFQFLHWYDRPEMYQGEPELEFFKDVPVTWDETRALAGEIGRYAVIARRRGDAWYLGILNAERRRQLDVPLNFLPPGRRYVATVYSDGAPQGGEPRNVHIERKTVDATSVLTADLAANGGQAVRLAPAPSK